MINEIKWSSILRVNCTMCGEPNEVIQELVKMKLFEQNKPKFMPLKQTASKCLDCGRSLSNNSKLCSSCLFKNNIGNSEDKEHAKNCNKCFKTYRFGDYTCRFCDPNTQKKNCADCGIEVTPTEKFCQKCLK